MSVTRRRHYQLFTQSILVSSQMWHSVNRYTAANSYFMGRKSKNYYKCNWLGTLWAADVSWTHAYVLCFAPSSQHGSKMTCRLFSIAWNGKDVHTDECEMLFGCIICILNDVQSYTIRRLSFISDFEFCSASTRFVHIIYVWIHTLFKA